MRAITRTEFNFSKQTAKYVGKVRDVYTIADDILVMIATDRISAFDVVLPEGIPYKGQVLNQIASMFLDSTSDIVPNWKIASPDPMVTVGYKCKGYPYRNDRKGLPYRKFMEIIQGWCKGDLWCKDSGWNERAPEI